MYHSLFSSPLFERGVLLIIFDFLHAEYHKYLQPQSVSPPTTNNNNSNKTTTTLLKGEEKDHSAEVASLNEELKALQIQSELRAEEYNQLDQQLLTAVTTSPGDMTVIQPIMNQVQRKADELSTIESSIKSCSKKKEELLQAVTLNTALPPIPPFRQLPLYPPFPVAPQ